MSLPKPKASHSRHPELPSLAEKETEEAIDNNHDWLIAARESIQRDLEASKKELELVRDLLGELEDGADVQKLDRKARDRLFSLRACQEYCGSQSCMLEERLRQIDLWSDDVRMGRSIPQGIPDEYVVSIPGSPLRVFYSFTFYVSIYICIC
ncbi:hypothetical protein F4774DRAFT_392622 [Daldinia eschscholtzii]|nr:hypothetical protein F4774DRAFT_392622 [Daldinia eschscholtzii]